MKVTRLLLANQEEIQQAKLYNQNMSGQGYNQFYNPKEFLEVPKPIWEEVPYNFIMRNVNSFYIQPPENDIICNINYEGLVRLKHDPILENQLELYMSLWH